MITSSNLMTRRAKPLFFYKKSLIYSKKNKVFFIGDEKKENILFKFKSSLLDNFLDSFSLVYRAKRSGVWSSAVFEDALYFSYDRKLYRYDCLKQTLVVDSTFKKGRGPLKYSVIDGLAGFDKCIAYGDYYGNSEKNEISVFTKSAHSDWEKIFTFNSGVINHIHNLVPDIYNDCVWILAGDFDEAASIWKATDNFKQVELVAAGDQMYRACVAFPTADGLVYATDSQFIENSVRILRKRDGLYVSEKIGSINGPAIYGTDHKDYFVFSTSTEPEMKFNRKNYKALLTSKQATKIIKNQSDIVLVKKDTLKTTVLLSKRKDRWPFALFQFGVIMFPNNTSDTNKLYFYSVGSKKNDLCTEYVDLSKVQN